MTTLTPFLTACPPRPISQAADQYAAELIIGISEQTFYRWKKKFQGMGVAEVRRLRVLEEENRKLKQLVADLSLDKQMLQDALRKSPEACPTAARGRLPPGGLPRQRTPGLRGTEPAQGLLQVPECGGWAGDTEDATGTWPRPGSTATSTSMSSCNGRGGR